MVLLGDPTRTPPPWRPCDDQCLGAADRALQGLVRDLEILARRAEDPSVTTILTFLGDSVSRLRSLASSKDVVPRLRIAPPRRPTLVVMRSRRRARPTEPS